MRPAKTQISLGICPVRSESSLSAWRKLGSLATHWAHSDTSDQTGWMTGIFAGRTDHFVGFFHEVDHLPFSCSPFFSYSMISSLNFSFFLRDLSASSTCTLLSFNLRSGATRASLVWNNLKPSWVFKAKNKSCVYCNMSGKKWVGRSGFCFSTRTTGMHIFVIMLHQHKFCVYKGKCLLKLLITCENFVFLCFNSFYFALQIFFLENAEKKVYSLKNGVLERVGRVTVNTTFFFHLMSHSQLDQTEETSVYSCLKHLLSGGSKKQPFSRTDKEGIWR